jgi:hypothetical protein
MGIHLFFTEPLVLSHWLDVCKPGGIITFTTKTSVGGKWEIEQDR